MQRSVIRRSLLALAILAMMVPELALTQISPGGPSRLVDLVEVSAHEEQIDLAVQFNCSMRYVTHLPASEGSELRVQLLPMGDCGLSPFAQNVPEVPPVSDETGTVVSARLESEAPGQVSLLLAFRTVQQFVIAQGTDPR